MYFGFLFSFTYWHIRAVVRKSIADSNHWSGEAPESDSREREILERSQVMFGMHTAGNPGIELIRLAKKNVSRTARLCVCKCAGSEPKRVLRSFRNENEKKKELREAREFAERRKRKNIVTSTHSRNVHRPLSKTKHRTERSEKHEKKKKRRALATL